MNTEAKIILISDYLENRMTPQQEEDFMKLLDEDEEMRNLFEDELMISAMIEEEAAKGTISLPGADEKEIESLPPPSMFQPADEHIAMIEKQLSEEVEKKNRHP